MTFASNTSKLHVAGQDHRSTVGVRYRTGMVEKAKDPVHCLNRRKTALRARKELNNDVWFTRNQGATKSMCELVYHWYGVRSDFWSE